MNKDRHFPGDPSYVRDSELPLYKVEPQPDTSAKGIADTVGEFRDRVIKRPSEATRLNQNQRRDGRWGIFAILSGVVSEEWLTAEEINSRLVKEFPLELIPSQIKILQNGNHPGDNLKERMRTGTATPEYKYYSLGLVA